MIKVSASVTVQYDNPFSPFCASEWREALRWVKDSGFDGVELIISDPNILDVDEILDELEQLVLPVSTLATGQASTIEGFGLISLLEHEREAAVKRLKEDVDLSTRLGKPNVTVGLIRGKGWDGQWDLQRMLLVQELGKIVKYAAARDVKINLEPINRYEVKYLNSTVSVAEFIEAMGNPWNLGILYDTFHSNIEDVDIYDTVRKMCRKFSHIHFADSNRRLPGEGHIDFARIIDILVEEGYGGYISIETLNIPNAWHIRNNAYKVKEIIERQQ